eukprot:6327336-Pyramimonas_sp.AAC.2
MFQEQEHVKREIRLEKIRGELQQGKRGIISKKLLWEDCAIYVRTGQYDVSICSSEPIRPSDQIARLYLNCVRIFAHNFDTTFASD